MATKNVNTTVKMTIDEATVIMRLLDHASKKPRDVVENLLHNAPEAKETMEFKAVVDSARSRF